MNKVIGENIVKYRKLNGMSQKFLASMLGISAQGLLKIERGLVSPRAATVERICETLCITPNQLFGIDKMDEGNASILHRLKQMQ